MSSYREIQDFLAPLQDFLAEFHGIKTFFYVKPQDKKFSLDFEWVLCAKIEEIAKKTGKDISRFCPGLPEIQCFWIIQYEDGNIRFWFPIGDNEYGIPSVVLGESPSTEEIRNHILAAFRKHLGLSELSLLCSSLSEE